MPKHKGMELDISDNKYVLKTRGIWTINLKPVSKAVSFPEGLQELHKPDDNLCTFIGGMEYVLLM